MSTPKKLATEALFAGDRKGFMDIIGEHPDELVTVGSYWINIAASKGFTDLLQFMMDRGVSLDSRDFLKGHPISSAASGGQIKAIEWLLANGASRTESESNDQDLPIQNAVYENHYETVRYLLSAGFDKSLKTKNGNDAIAYARVHSTDEMVELLGGTPVPRAPWVNTSFPAFNDVAMTHEKIEAVEAELSISFPVYLAQFLLDRFPAELLFSDAEDSDQWEWLGPDSQLFHTARSFIAYNSEESRDEKKKLWSKRYLVIGTDGSEIHWCVRFDEVDEVYEHDSETNRFRKTGKSIDEHARFLAAEE